MRHSGSIQSGFQQQKLDAVEAFELVTTARKAGRRQGMIGPLGADMDYHIQNQHDYLQMIAFIRALENNDPVVAAAGQRLMYNVNVGQMTPTPQTGDEKVNEHLRGIWDEFTADPDLCDQTGRMTFETMADVAFLRTIFDGDVLPVPDGSGAILNLESHRCQTPMRGRLDRGVCGVRTDGKRPTDYFLTMKNTGFNRQVKVTDVRPLKARNEEGWLNVFHVMRPRFFTLNRGVSSLHAVGSAAARRDDLEFATILKAQVASCVTFIEEIDKPELFKKALQGAGSLQSLPSTFEETDLAGNEVSTVQMHAGRHVRAAIGRKLRMDSPDIPSDGQLQLNMLLIQYIATCVDLPLIVLLLDASDATFSSYRNVLDQARLAFGKHHQWFSAQYHRRVYRNLVRVRLQTDSFLRGFVNANKTLDLRRNVVFKHRWNSAAYKYQHPVDDAMGDILLLSNSMMSFEQYARQRYGLGAEQLLSQVIGGNETGVRLAIEAAARIKSGTGVEVPWQYFFSVPNRSGFNLQLVEQNESDQRLKVSSQSDSGAAQ